MPDIDITQLAEHGPALAAFMQARRQAAEAGDEMGVLRAENAWKDKQNELFRLAHQRGEAETAKALAMAEAEAKYPKAPKPVYANLTDPQAILAAAKEAHDAITAATPQQTAPPGTPPGTPPPAGGWPAPGGAQPPAGQPAGQSVEDRKRELVPAVRRGAAAEHENQEFRSLIFGDQIAPRFDFIREAQGQQR